MTAPDEDRVDRIRALMTELRDEHPDEFAKAAAPIAGYVTGVDPRTLLASRPDLAAMRDTIPTRSGTSPVDLQAAAQRVDAKPYVEFDGARWYLARSVDLFDLAELGEAIDAADSNPLSALGTINRCLREWLVDYPGLRARFRARHDGAGEAAMEAWAGLAQGVFSAVVARPTGAPDGSWPGRTSTSTSSKDDGPSTGQTPQSAPYTHGS